MTSEKPGRRKRLRKLFSGGALTLGPMVLLLTFFWEDLTERLSVPALSGSAVLLVLVGFLGLVGEEIGRRWAKLAAPKVDPYRWWWVARQRRAYVEQLAEHASEIQLYGVATHGPFAMRLPEVHVAVGLVRPRSSDLPEADHKGRTLLDAVDGPERRAYIVVGEPGAGKTTLLRHTALQACQSRRLQRRHLPVLIYLRDHVETILDDPAETTIASLLAETPSLKHRAIAGGVRQRLESGRCLVLLDGLDEMAGVEARQEVARWIKAQMEYYSKCDFVVTARRQGYDNTVLADLDTLRVRRFDWPQIERFVRNWCYSMRCQETGEAGRAVRVAADRDADRLVKLMGDSRELRELVTNPLLLIMVCNVDRYRGQLPGGRAELYREMCEMLIHRRRQQAGVHSHFDPLTARQKVAPLRALALGMMRERTRRATATEAVEIFGERLKGAPRRVHPEDYLRQAVENGILVEDGHETYAFAHATLQEYLAAAALRESGDEAFLAARIDKVWWRETILLWAAEGEADAIVSACLQAGDVDSLLLAEECMDVAAELDPGLQARLRSLLDDQSGLDTGDRALVDEWLLRRNTAESVPVGPESDLCVVPVRYAVWARFLTDLRFNDCLEPPGRIRDGEAAVGMWPIYVQKFLNWANHYAQTGHRYRLPDASELAEYFTAVPAGAVGRPLWVSAVPGPRLYCPRGVAHTYTASRADVLAVLHGDREHTHGHRMVALAIHIAMQRKDEQVRNPMQFRHSFGLARATDTDRPPGEILEQSFQQLLVRIRTVSGFRGWHPAFDWEEHLSGLGGNAFVQSMVRQDLFPDRVTAHELLSVRAYLILVSLWTREAVQRPQNQPEAEAEERYLDSVASDETDAPVYPDQVVPAVRVAARALAARGGVDDAFEPLVGKAIAALRDCERLIAPILDRQARYDAEQFAAARLALNAAAAVAHQLLEADDAIDHLRRAIRGLVVVSARAASDEDSGGEFLLLVRERMSELTEPEHPERPQLVVRRKGRLTRAVARWWRRLTGDRRPVR